MEIIHTPPSLSTFTPLAEHQSRTPQSFYSGPPVLYHHSEAARIKVRESSLRACPALGKFVEEGPMGLKESDSGGGLTNGHGDAGQREGEGEEGEGDNDGERTAQVDIWVTSEKFLLWRPESSIGLAIPYPSISLHAISSEGLYLQLVTSTTPFDDHDPAISAEVTLIPTSPSAIGGAAADAQPATGDPSSPVAAIAPTATEEGRPTQSPSLVSALFDAVSACANLHPDPLDDDDDDAEDGEGGMLDDGAPYAVLGAGVGGMPPPMPGSGGWITSENVGDFFDDEGNWRTNAPGSRAAEGEQGNDQLGPGAGVVRGRETEDEGMGEGGQRMDGVGEEEESKWRRTE